MFSVTLYTLLPRYKVVDYTSPISINRGIILSKKPGPASSIFNVVKVSKCWFKSKAWTGGGGGGWY